MTPVLEILQTRYVDSKLKEAPGLAGFSYGVPQTTVNGNKMACKTNGARKLLRRKGIVKGIVGITKIRN